MLISADSQWLRLYSGHAIESHLLIIGRKAGIHVI